MCLVPQITLYSDAIIATELLNFVLKFNTNIYRAIITLCEYYSDTIGPQITVIREIFVIKNFSFVT